MKNVLVALLMIDYDFGTEHREYCFFQRRENKYTGR
jgi:hypothetical protein